MPEDSYARELGERIAAVAEKVGGKRALAKKTGIKETQIYRYINGTNMPGVNVVSCISETTGTDAGWLVSGKGSISPRDSDEKAPDEPDPPRFTIHPHADLIIRIYHAVKTTAKRKWLFLDTQGQMELLRDAYRLATDENPTDMRGWTSNITVDHMSSVNEAIGILTGKIKVEED